MGATEPDHERADQPSVTPGLQTGRRASLLGVLLAGLVAWPVLDVPGLIGWRHGARAQAASTGFEHMLDAPFDGLVGLAVGALLLVPVWFLLRRRVPLSRSWPAVCLALTVPAFLPANALFEPSSALVAGLPALAGCWVATALCAKRAGAWARAVPLALVIVLALVMALDTRAVHQRHHAERLAAWQAAGSTFWMPAESEMNHLNSCYLADQQPHWLWLPSDGALGIQAVQSATRAAPSKPHVVSTSPLAVVVVEQGGQQVRLEAVDEHIPASRLLSMAQHLRPVDAEWMVARCG